MIPSDVWVGVAMLFGAIYGYLVGWFDRKLSEERRRWEQEVDDTDG